MKRTNKLNGSGKSVENMLTATLWRGVKTYILPGRKKEFQHVDGTQYSKLKQSWTQYKNIHI